MRITSKELLHLAVRTRSGIALGQVIGFELDTLQLLIEKFFVKKAGLASLVPTWPKLETADYVIDRKQVITINSTEMVVEDALIKDEIPGMLKKQLISPEEGEL